MKRRRPYQSGDFSFAVFGDFSIAIDNISGKYARSAFVFTTCFSGTAIRPLSDENRIIITSSMPHETTKGWMESTSHEERTEHIEFLHNDDEIYGFTLALGENNSLFDAYVSGYQAARENEYYWNPFDPVDETHSTSHPLLDDDGDGIWHYLESPGGMDGDRWLALKTYL